MTSRVVPASSDTIATSRRASAFSRLDLPALGGPAMTTRKPSRRPLAAAGRQDGARSRRAAWRRQRRPCAAASAASRRPRRRSRGRPRSAPAPESARCAPTLVERAQRAFGLRAAPGARCASVSASMRSARPSTSVRSSLPFSKARRANSPGSASRHASKREQRIDDGARPRRGRRAPAARPCPRR